MKTSISSYSFSALYRDGFTIFDAVRKAKELGLDGFEIAEKDLELRGAGDLFGFRQSGLGDSGLLGLTDGKTMKQASEDAKRSARWIFPVSPLPSSW